MRKLHMPQTAWAKVLVVVGAAAAVAGITGVAFATIPDSNGVIHGCYSANGADGTNGTQLNIINPEKASCSKGQTAVSWSQTGPTGPQGPQGAQGPQGDPGPSTLSALQGSPCTFDGNPSTVNVSIDSTTGAVSIVCTPVYKVTVTSMTGVTLPSAQIYDYRTNARTLCGSFPCSAYVTPGDQVQVALFSGSVGTGGGAPFDFSCDGGPSQTANTGYPAVSGTYYEGDCKATITSDYTAAASASG